MTYIQFRNIIEGIGRKINWDMKMAVASVGAEIKDEDFPLFSKSNEDKVFRMSDAMTLRKHASS